MSKIKLLLLLATIFACFACVRQVYASNTSFVTVVNPVRGSDFWQSSKLPADGVSKQMQVLTELNIPATWLIRTDALLNQDLVTKLKSTSSKDELGLFLEVTPAWTNLAQVEYRKSPAWQFAGSVFLSGYQVNERTKLLDSAFSKFKDTFGFYPRSVGAWWIDSYSLAYLKSKYKITSALIVADQYTTDNYQIWGQYWATPYYPSKKDLLIPAQSVDDKLGIVVMQWAARDPVNGYGKGVEESTFSVQVNDYLDYHHLDTNYFSKLVDVFTKQDLNGFNQLTVGLENSYSLDKYQDEYHRQMRVLAPKEKMGQFQFSTMSGFSDWYQATYPGISPEHTIVSADPLGSFQKSVWFMNPFYRAGWFYNLDGSVLRDIRQYISGSVEPCFDTPCQELNFATFSTRVLDDVTYQQKWVLDMGKISNFSFSKQGSDYTISYINEAGTPRSLKFLPRDVSFKDKISSIDGAILEATTQKAAQSQKSEPTGMSFDISGTTYLNWAIQGLKFIVLVLICFTLPGLLILKGLKNENLFTSLFLATLVGMTSLVLVSYILGYLQISWVVYIYLLGSLFIFIRLGKNFWEKLEELSCNLAQNWLIILVILCGTLFQITPVVASGVEYGSGVGFWGPNGHDGLWHQALVSQIEQKIPPQNPIFSGQTLSNYHYFYDLLVAETKILTGTNVSDLIYRFYPLFFSLMLGFGTWILAKQLFREKLGIFFSLYFVYFAGSFGWIVEYLKNRQILAGESDFWANQSISFNLNPPFAISLIMVISVIILFFDFVQTRRKMLLFPLILISGSLIEFKVYAGVIVLGALGIVGLYDLFLRRKLALILSFLASVLLSGLVFLPQNSRSSDLLVVSPFWFIHSMIDFPDRVGWLKLSAARMTYYQRGDWLKWLASEGVAFLIFIFGNLGIRSIIFLAGKVWINFKFSFILILMAISLIIPVIFIQKGNPWNTIQFIYYFLYLSALIAGGVSAQLYQKLKKFGLILIIFILILTPISSYSTFRGYLFPRPHAYLSLGELKALNFLKGQPKGIILTYPYDKNLKQKIIGPIPILAYETTAYVAAYSEDQTFLEDEIQQEILQNDYKKRLVATKDFLSGKDVTSAKNFLKSNDISYVYLPKVYQVNLDTGKLGLKKIFENQEVDAYQVLKSDVN